MANPLRGIVPPLMTPLLDRDALDVAGLERLVERVLTGGVHGIFVLGTTGEGPALSYRLRRELVERVVTLVSGRVPVLVGVTDAAYVECRAMAEFAAEAGATAMVMAPPYYFSSSQADLLRLIQALTTDCTLPLYLYNMPAMTKVAFAPETVARAAELPTVCGFKDSSGDLEYLKKVVAAVRATLPGADEFAMFVGPQELLLDALRMGLHGGVIGTANLYPRLYVDLYEAFTQGRLAEAEALHVAGTRLGDALFDPVDEEYRYVRGLKCALAMLGVCSEVPAWPYQPATQKVRDTIATHLRSELPPQYRSE